MGFRYVSVEGIDKSDIVNIEGVALYSDIPETGSFECSNDLINRLQENIRWGAKSNLVDIPTDCPQRDERMGWTGDIAVFAPTACYNFDMSRFLDKWLRDVRAEQLPTGGIPNTVPVQGYGFPATMPQMAIDWWGDACVLVPWAEYRARGDKELLKKCYPMMKKYVKACKFWAGLLSFGKNKYIWNTPATLHFGDWVAPDVPKMSQWQGRAKWTATASLRNTSHFTALVAKELGYNDEAAEYEKLSERVKDAYISKFTDGNGKLLEEFQTAYVLPIYMDMFDKKTAKKAAANLAELVKKNDYCIGTGFPGTPYILFALAANGQEEVAFKMLENTKCPSWLYEVKSGATTIWERWDGLDENGQCPIGDDGTDMMISYNHYASGAVGNFFYREIAGIKETEAGYKTFEISPKAGGSITAAKGCVNTPYGSIISDWNIEGSKMTVRFTVPIGTTCKLVLPNGKTETFGSGSYTVTE
nr:alpha-L-rhamnosidase [Lachnospiraceae bacterium]